MCQKTTTTSHCKNWANHQKLIGDILVDAQCDEIINETTGPVEPCAARLALEETHRNRGGPTDDDIRGIHVGGVLFEENEVHERSDLECVFCAHGEDFAVLPDSPV